VTVSCLRQAGAFTGGLPEAHLSGSVAFIVVSSPTPLAVENKDQSPFIGVDNYGDSVSGWYLAGKWLLSMLRLTPPLRIPSLSEIGLKVSYISHSMQLAQFLRHADDSVIYMRPDVGTRFGLLDYDRMSTIVGVGKMAAEESLAAWERRQQRKGERARAKVVRQHSKALRRAPSVAELGHPHHLASNGSSTALLGLSPPRRPLSLPPQSAGPMITSSGGRSSMDAFAVPGSATRRAHGAAAALALPSAAVAPTTPRAVTPPSAAAEQSAVFVIGSPEFSS